MIFILQPPDEWCVIMPLISMLSINIFTFSSLFILPLLILDLWMPGSGLWVLDTWFADYGSQPFNCSHLEVRLTSDLRPRINYSTTHDSPSLAPWNVELFHWGHFHTFALSYLRTHSYRLKSHFFYIVFITVILFPAIKLLGKP